MKKSFLVKGKHTYGYRRSVRNTSVLERKGWEKSRFIKKKKKRYDENL